MGRPGALWLGIVERCSVESEHLFSVRQMIAHASDVNPSWLPKSTQRDVRPRGADVGIRPAEGVRRGDLGRGNQVLEPIAFVRERECEQASAAGVWARDEITPPPLSGRPSQRGAQRVSQRADAVGLGPPDKRQRDVQVLGRRRAASAPTAHLLGELDEGGATLRNRIQSDEQAVMAVDLHVATTLTPCLGRACVRCHGRVPSLSRLR